MVRRATPTTRRAAARPFCVAVSALCLVAAAGPIHGRSVASHVGAFALGVAVCALVVGLLARQRAPATRPAEPAPAVPDATAGADAAAAPAAHAVDPRALLEHAGGDGAMRDAMRRIRAIVSGVEGEPAPLAEVIADARFDAVLRLGARGVAVDWPPPEPDPNGPVLGGAARQALAAFFHEAVTNVLKHAGATRVTARAGVGAGAARGVLTCEVVDDGAGFDPGVGRTGHGLGIMHARAGSLGGTLVITSRRGEGTTLRLVAPVAVVVAGADPAATVATDAG